MALFKLFGKKKKAAEPEETKPVIDVREAFAGNLKYISGTEKDAAKINGQFVKTNTRYFLTIGRVSCPTGSIIVSDPLAYLPSAKFCPVLAATIPAGEYPVEAAICRSDQIGIRICTVRMKIKDTPAAEYRPAEPTEESAAMKCSDGPLSGFPVDAGMMCICDAQTAEEYKKFIDVWEKENPDGNYYDDYFAALFKESEERLPQFQREGGDFIEWAIPETGNRLVMAASGFGDGFYQSYWGYDSGGDICELAVPLVDPDLFGL